MKKRKKIKIQKLRFEIKKLLDKVDRKVGEINALVYLEKDEK